jgi:dGTPase
MIARDRRFQEESARSDDPRTPAQIDRDRILYSPHFSRLAEVTQVRSVSGDFLVHNRLTHSLKVAQVAQRVAQALAKKEPGLARDSNLDADAAEAAGLAHDLGHPPFGHIAEEKLNELVSNSESEKNEGYEGNAQSFRIVAALSVSDSASKDQEFIAGLNLTSATLNAVLKYPWTYGKNPKYPKKWGSYQTEKNIFAWARGGDLSFNKSVEAEIMDWADDITYAIHDMVDFYSAGLIPLHILAGRRDKNDLSRREWERFFESTCEHDREISRGRKDYEEALETALSVISIDGPFIGSQQQSSRMWQSSSALIDQYTRAIDLVDPNKNSGRHVKIGEAAVRQTKILKQLTWHYVIRRSDLATAQHGQQQIIGALFEVFKEAIERKHWDLFPMGFSQLIRDNKDKNVSPARWAADYISGLTERQVFELHRKLSGGI